MSHTPEPITRSGRAIRVGDPERFRIIIQPIDDGWAMHAAEMESVIRHFVACYNACKGIPTEVLEGGPPLDLDADAANRRAEAAERLLLNAETILSVLPNVNTNKGGARPTVTTRGVLKAIRAHLEQTK